MNDLIKREDAIKAIEDLPNAYNGWSEAYDKAYIIQTIEEVPSAENKGEWIEIWENGMSTKAMCNNCKRESGRPLGNFCKWCGARMK